MYLCYIKCMVPVMVEYLGSVVLLHGEEPPAEGLVLQPEPGHQVQLVEHPATRGTGYTFLGTAKGVQCPLSIMPKILRWNVTEFRIPQNSTDGIRSSAVLFRRLTEFCEIQNSSQRNTRNLERFRDLIPAESKKFRGIPPHKIQHIYLRQALTVSISASSVSVKDRDWSCRDRADGTVSRASSSASYASRSFRRHTLNF